MHFLTFYAYLDMCNVLLIFYLAAHCIISQEGKTPLLIAVRKGNLVLARELLEAGANPNHMEEVSIVL